MKKHKIIANPNVPTVTLNRSQRAIGKLVNIELDQEPEGQSQVDLGGDLFWSLYGDVSAIPKDSLPGSRQINAALMDLLKGNKGWLETLESSKDNMPVSLASSALCWATLTTDEALKDALEKQREAEEKEQEAAAAQAHCDGLNAAAQAAEGEGDEEGAAQYAEMAAAVQAQANEAQGQAEEMAAAAAQMVEDAASDPAVKAAIGQQMKDAAEDAKEMSEGMAAYGLDSGNTEYTDPAAALRFAQLFDNKLAEIAKMAGRFRGIATQQSREKVEVGHVIGDVQRTRNLLEVLPTELAFLRQDAPPAIRTKKVIEYAESGLPGYKKFGEAKEEGPVVIVVDGSGSMAGLPEIIAKSVAIGVGQAVEAGGRPFILVSFASDRDPVYVYDSRESWEERMIWASKFQNGGTSFSKAFEAMITALDDLGSRAQGVDAIFVSDGAGALSEHWRTRWVEYREERGSRFLLVPVGSFNPYYLRGIPDEILSLPRLDETAGVELAKSMADWIR